MNPAHDAIEQRRARRKRVDFTAMVTDAISGQPFGQLANLSASGMLLISTHAPRSEAIYQLRLSLSNASQPQHVELGVQEQWHAPAATPGQVWAGYRIIAINEADAMRLDAWLTQPG